MANAIFGSNFGFTYDGTTLAVTGIVNASTAFSVGNSSSAATTPATTGGLRLPNNSFISARNAANTSDANLIALDSSNIVSIASSSANVVLCQGQTNPFLGFGSVSSASFVAFKRSGTTLLLRLGDDSGYATLDTLGLKSSNAAGASFGPSAVASLTTVNGIVTAAS